MEQKHKTKKRLLSLFLTLVLVLSMLPISGAIATSAAEYDGTPVTPTQISSSNYKMFGLKDYNWSEYDGYYGIRTAAELYGFAQLNNNASQTTKLNAVLLQDIALNKGTITASGSSSGTTYSWTPIGTTTRPFVGIFDGNGHTVSGIYISSGSNVGLFGMHGSLGGSTKTYIKNLVIANSYICGSQNVGGVAGEMTGVVSYIDKCKIASDVTIKATNSSQAYVGGIVGGFGTATAGSAQCHVDNCVVFGSISSASSSFDYTGAIVGFYRVLDNAWELIAVGDNGTCYYQKNIVSANGSVQNYGKGGIQGTRRDGNCTQLDSASSSHTCLSVEHKEETVNCKYDGCSYYSFCLICGKVTSGAKIVTSANSNYHVLKNEVNCKNGSSCMVCGATFDKDANTHASDDVAYTCLNDNEHKKYHACCNAFIANETHTFTSDDKTVCKYCGIIFSKPATVTSSNYESLNLDKSYIGYYAISNAQELYWFSYLTNGKLTDTAQNTSAKAVVVKDITVNKNVVVDGSLSASASSFAAWQPIGDYSNNGTKGFFGTFDGNGHTISGLYFDRSESYDGFIGNLGAKGSVKNLIIADSYFRTTGNNIGGIAGFSNGSIEKCASEKCIIKGSKYVGGIAGCNSAANINNCYSTSALSGANGWAEGYAGGIAGSMQRSGSIKNCYFAGKVLCGDYNASITTIVNNDNSNNAVIDNCYYDTSVDNNPGVNNKGNRGSVTNVYSKNTTQFKSGEITYLLNNGTTDGTQAWYQTLTGSGAQDYPQFEGETVTKKDGNYLNGTEVTIKGVTALNETYDGAKHVGYTGTPSNDNGYTGEYEISYVGRNSTVYSSTKAPVNAGDYSVIISVDTKQVDYKGSVKVDFTIYKKDIGVAWKNTSFVYDGTIKQPTATATSTIFGDEVTLKVEGGKIDANKDGESYTATVTGIEGKDAGNYQLVSDATLTKTFTIARAQQDAPSGLKGQAETIDGRENGEITGVDNTMEYRKDDEVNYTAITGDKLTDLADGTYYIRYAKKANYDASPDAVIVLSCDTKMNVTIPETQTGYTLTVDKDKLKWHDSLTITFELKAGYSELSNFAIRVNSGEPISLKDGECILTNIESDISITVEGVADVTAPTATITLGENSWNKFFNDITFGLFFKDTQKVEISADDEGSGVDKIYYYLATSEFSEEQVKAIALSDWKEYTGAFSINPQEEYIIYVKATDKDNNAVYISSEKGIVVDTIAPVIEGVKDGETHYGDTTFSVSDKHLNIVEVDGENVALTGGKYTIKADGKEHTIVATDKSGNSSKTITITVITIASIDDEIEDITLDNVKSSDKQDISDVRDLVNTLINSGKDFTDAENEQLYEIKENVEDLLKKIDEVKAKSDELAAKVDDYDENTVKSDDKQDILDLITEIDELLNKDNLTQEEKDELSNVKETAEDLVTKIDETEKELEDLKDKVNEYNKDEVTSDDKQDILDLITKIDELLDADNLNEAEKEELSGVKDTANELIEQIEEAASSSETENTDKVKDVTSDNVKPEDKSDLENAKEDLEKAFDDYEGNLTDDEKQDIIDEIERIEDALDALERVEEVEDLINSLPDNITKDDEAAIEQAKKAYDSLTEHEQSIVNKDVKEKLDKAILALEELNKAGNSSTGDMSNLLIWFMLIALCGAGVITTVCILKKRHSVK